MPDTLPPIESWWPHLTVGARHDVLRDPTSPLSTGVVGEVERIAAVILSPDERLSEADRQYIATQSEPVD